MSVSLPQPSTRLRRASEAEQAAVTRHRERLRHQRDRLAANLRELDNTLRAVDERLALLSTLSQPPTIATRADATTREPPRDDRCVLRGSAIRETAVQVLIAQPERIEALHYRDWYELVRNAGYTAAGSNPLAAFLTQVTRSPIVHKSTASGVYAVDSQAPLRIREQLERLAAELHAVTAATPSSVELAQVRARRHALDLAISQHERALEEALRTLNREQLDDAPRQTARGER